jgi:hypothetical protein
MEDNLNLYTVSGLLSRRLEVLKCDRYCVYRIAQVTLSANLYFWHSPNFVMLVIIMQRRG